MGNVIGWADEITIRGGGVLFSDQFEGNLVGWTKTQTGGPVSWDGSNGCWKSPSISLYKQYQTGSTQAFHSLSEKTTGRVSIEARAKLSTTASWKWCYLNLYNSAGALETYLVLRDGYIYYYSPTTGWQSTTFSYSAGSWFKVSLDVDLETGTYDIYGNGVKIVSGAPLWVIGTHNIGKVGLQAGTYNDLYGVTLWCDDIVVSWR